MGLIAIKCSDVRVVSRRARIALGISAFAIVISSTHSSAQDAAVPNFSPSNEMGWLKTGFGDEFLPPVSGPGPVKFDPAHPYISNGQALQGTTAEMQETIKIADITNPILQPWAAEKMRTANEEVLAGKVGFTARSRCWPHGVPGFLLYPVHPLFFIQTPKEVLMIWGQDFQLRRVYLVDQI